MRAFNIDAYRRQQRIRAAHNKHERMQFVLQCTGFGSRWRLLSTARPDYFERIIPRYRSGANGWDGKFVRHREFRVVLAWCVKCRCAQCRDNRQSAACMLSGKEMARVR